MRSHQRMFLHAESLTSFIRRIMGKNGMMRVIHSGMKCTYRQRVSKIYQCMANTVNH